MREDFRIASLEQTWSDADSVNDSALSQSSGKVKLLWSAVTLGETAFSTAFSTTLVFCGHGAISRNDTVDSRPLGYLMCA